jgi:lipid A 3-O-deacylase
LILPLKRIERLLRVCAGLALAVMGTGRANADAEVQALAVAVAAVVLAEIYSGRPVSEQRAHVAVEGGAFDAVSGEQPAAAFGAEYRPGAILVWKLRPFVGAGFTSDQSAYGYGGIRLATYWGRHVVIAPSLAIGAYSRGDGKDLGSPPVIGRFGLDFEYAFDRGVRVGLAYHHMSNGQVLGQTSNPGTQIVGITVSTLLE